MNKTYKKPLNPILRKKVRRIVSYINVFTMFGLIMSYLSVFISPEDFVWFAYFGLAYPFLLILNVLFIIFWIIMKNRMFFYPLTFVLLGFPFIGQTIQINPKTLFFQRNPQQTKVLSYNVRLFDRYNWIQEAGTDQDIIQFLKNESPDIICFQEYYSNPNNPSSIDKAIEKATGLKYKFISTAEQNHEKINSGLAIYSRFPIIGKDIFKYQDNKTIGMYVDLEINQDTIRVFTCHLASVHLGYKEYGFLDSLGVATPEDKMKGAGNIVKKLNQAFISRSREVHIISEEIKNSPHKVIVCGDFNDTPISYAYDKMRGDLNDAFDQSGFGFGNSYVRGIWAFRIDNIFHDKKLKSDGFKTHKIRLSDHYPISCLFEIGKQEAL